MDDQYRLPDLSGLSDDTIFFLLLLAAALFVLLFPILAAHQAPDGRRLMFFFLTLCVGPLAPFMVALAACARPGD
jgi:hypothetical protein